MRQLAIDCRELTSENLKSIGLYLRDLIESIRGVELVAFSPTPLPEELQAPFAACHVWGKPMRGGAEWISYQKWIEGVLDEERYEVFYETNHFLFIRPKHTKTVTTIHDLYPISGIEDTPLKAKILFKASIASTLRFSDVVIVRSEATKADVEKRFRPRRDLFVNSPALSLGEAARAQNPVGGKYMLVVGRICPWKGQERLVDLYIRHLEDAGLKLVLAGFPENAEVASRIEAVCDEHPGIVCTGYVDDETKTALLANCELFCYPSKFDGFGVPPLEAMAMRRKCLMNDIPILRETTKGRGRYVDFYGSDSSVVAAIKGVLDEDAYPYEDLYGIATSYTIENSIAHGMEIVDSVEFRR